MRLSIFGLGQVGQVLCACFAERGHAVLGVDVDPAKVADLSHGITRIHEPKLSEMLARHVASGLIAATGDPRNWLALVNEPMTEADRKRVIMCSTVPSAATPSLTMNGTARYVERNAVRAGPGWIIPVDSSI